MTRPSQDEIAHDILVPLVRFAYQTIIFGPVFRDIAELDNALEVIADAGFQGIELMQRPDRLGFAKAQPSYADLAPLLRKHNLQLVGMAGGSVQERAEFLGLEFHNPSVEPPYLYVEQWSQEDQEWAEISGTPLALHAHYCKEVHSLEDAVPILNAHPDLKWIPDTAHLRIVGDDVLRAITEYYDRLATVHFKDWTDVLGRVSHRYSRGFTELGLGVAPIHDALRLLLERDFRGWLTVEQDSSTLGPEASIWRAAEWLKDNGAPIRPKRLHPVSQPKTVVGSGGLKRLCFLEGLNDALAKPSPGFYEDCARVTAELYDAKLVAVWAYSDPHRILSLVASWPPRVLQEETERTAKGTLHELPLIRMGPEIYNLDPSDARFYRNAHPGREYPYLDLAVGLGARWLLSIPVLNSFNPNHIRFLVNVLGADEMPLRSQDPLLIAADLARTADVHGNERCIEAVARAGILSGRAKVLDDFLNEMCKLVRELLACEGCSIFLLNSSGTKLEPRGTTGIEWRAGLMNHEKCYQIGDCSNTMEVFRRREPRVYREATQEVLQSKGKPARSWETVATPKRNTALFSPILDKEGRCIGVLRCRNKTKSGVVSFFTDDDLAAVESLLQVGVPHLAILRAEEGRIIAFKQLKHELKNPLIAIRGVLDNLQSEINLRFQFPGFDKNYFDDALSWSDLMLGLLGRLDLISRGQDIVRPRVSTTNLKSDVIAPVIRQFRMALAEKSFAKGSIRHGDVKIPPLRIDRAMFQQVVFNLVDNAIKYAKADPRSFRVAIDGWREGHCFVLQFQDNGLGIEPGFEKAIFEEAVRGPNAHQSAVEGQGLGLWLVRRIVEAHGGTIELTSIEAPTEFRIELPEWLTTRAPQDSEPAKGVR
jgi:signal transduction histidine kinase/sugar phosphate isomerase/epimerase